MINRRQRIVLWIAVLLALLTCAVVPALMGASSAKEEGLDLAGNWLFAIVCIWSFIAWFAYIFIFLFRTKPDYGSDPGGEWRLRDREKEAQERETE